MNMVILWWIRKILLFLKHKACQQQQDQKNRVIIGQMVTGSPSAVTEWPHSNECEGEINKLDLNHILWKSS